MASSRQICVLIVDDERGVADVLNDATTGFGHQTAVALNGAHALRAVREFGPDVVLLDIQMPGIDGDTLLEHLKRSPRPPAIIIVSGNADEQEARQPLQRAAVEYVTKHVALNDLRQTMP